jgi:TRAP-type C4-dicarboxylate transport system permease small subunit
MNPPSARWRYVLEFRWANVASKITGYLSGAALLAATFTMMHGVASRYFFGYPTIWQTEFSIYLLMFVTFVGAAYGLHHHAHVGVDLLVQSAPPRVQLALRLLSSVLSLLVIIVVLYTATAMWWEATEGGWTSSTAWRAPLSMVYAILPLGMLLVACQYIAFIIEGVQGLLGTVSLDRVELLRQFNPELTHLPTASGSDAATSPIPAPSHTGRS